MTESQLKTAAWAWWIFGAVVGVIVIIAGVSASVLEPIQLATGVPLIVVYGFYLAEEDRRASYLVLDCTTKPPGDSRGLVPGSLGADMSSAVVMLPLDFERTTGQRQMSALRSGPQEICPFSPPFGPALLRSGRRPSLGGADAQGDTMTDGSPRTMQAGCGIRTRSSLVSCAIWSGTGVDAGRAAGPAATR